MGLFTKPLKIDISEIINPTPVDYKLKWAHEVKIQYAQKYTKLKMMAKKDEDDDEIISKQLRGIRHEREAVSQDTTKTYEERKKRIAELEVEYKKLYAIQQDLNDSLNDATKEVDKQREILRDMNSIELKINKETERRIKFKEDAFKFEKLLTSGVEKRIEKMKSINGVQQVYVNMLETAGTYQRTAINNWAKSLKLTKDLTDTQKQIKTLQVGIDAALATGKGIEAEILKHQQQKLKLINAVEATGRAINKGLELSKKLWSDIKKAASMVGSAVGLLLKPFKALDSALGGILGNAIKLVTNPLALLGVMLTSALDIMKKFNQETVSLSRQFGIQGQQLAKIDGIAKGLFEKYHDMGVELEQMNEYIGAAEEGLGNLDYLTKKNVEMVLQMNKGWGVSTSAAGEFVGMMSKMTGEGDKGAKKMMNLAKAMSDAKGIPVAKVIEDVANAGEEAYGFLSGMPDKLIATAAEARRLGMSLDSVAKISRGLLDVQSSIGAEMEASIMTGKNLNFNLARQKALQGDIIGAQNEIMQQLGGIDEFNKMDILQKEAIAKATGLSVKELSKTMLQREKEAQLAEERVNREKHMNEMLDKGYDLFQKISSIGEKWSAFFFRIKEVLAKAIMPYVERVMLFLEKNFTKIIKTVDTFVSDIFMPFFKLAWELAKDVLGIFGINLGKSSDMMTGMNEMLEQWGDTIKTKVIPWLQDAYHTYVRPIVEWIRNLISETKNWLKYGGWQHIKNTFNDVVEAAKSLWSELGKVLNVLGLSSGAKSSKGITGVLDTVLTVIQKIAGIVKALPFPSLLALGAMKFEGFRSILGGIGKGALKFGLNLRGDKQGKTFKDTIAGIQPVRVINFNEAPGGSSSNSPLTDESKKGFFKSQIGRFKEAWSDQSELNKRGIFKGSKLKAGLSSMVEGAGGFKGLMKGAGIGALTGAAMNIGSIIDLANSDTVGFTGENTTEALESKKSKREELGGTIGGTVGGAALGAVGAIFGPAGAAIGGMIGEKLGSIAGKAVSGWFKSDAEKKLEDLSSLNEELKVQYEADAAIVKNNVNTMFGKDSALQSALKVQGDAIALTGPEFDNFRAQLINTGAYTDEQFTTMMSSMSSQTSLTGAELKALKDKLSGEEGLNNIIKNLSDDVTSKLNPALIEAAKNAGSLAESMAKAAKDITDNEDRLEDAADKMFGKDYAKQFSGNAEEIYKKINQDTKFKSFILSQLKLSGKDKVTQEKGLKQYAEDLKFQIEKAVINPFEGGPSSTDIIDALQSTAQEMKKTTELDAVDAEAKKTEAELQLERERKIPNKKNDFYMKINDAIIQANEKDQILATTDMQGMLKTVGDLARKDMSDELASQSDDDKKFELDNIKKENILNKKWFGVESMPYLKTIADVLSAYFDQEMISFKKTQIQAQSASNTYMGGIVNASNGIQIEQNAINRGIGGAVPGTDKPFYNANLGVYMHTGETIAKTASGGMAVLNRDQQRLLATGGYPQFSKNMAGGGLLTLAESIAQFEGYNKSGSRANRNNNPGNIEFGTFAKEHGAYKGDPRFAIFPSADSGWKALQTLISSKYSNLTLYNMMAKYAPPSENDTKKYADFLAKKVNATVNTLVSSIIAGSTIEGVSSTSDNQTNGTAAAGWLMSMLPGFGAGKSNLIGPMNGFNAALSGTKQNKLKQFMQQAIRDNAGAIYVFGGSDRGKYGGHSTDCSGLVSAVENEAQRRLVGGVKQDMSGNAKSISQSGTQIPMGQEIPGDVVFRSSPNPKASGHIGVVVDKGQVYHIGRSGYPPNLPNGQPSGVSSWSSLVRPNWLQNYLSMALGGIIGIDKPQTTSTKGIGDAAPLDYEIKSPVKDFILQNAATGTQITPIANNDTIFGAQPGGVLAQGNNQIINMLKNILNAMIENTKATKENKEIRVTKLSGVEG